MATKKKVENPESLLLNVFVKQKNLGGRGCLFEFIKIFIRKLQKNFLGYCFITHSIIYLPVWIYLIIKALRFVIWKLRFWTFPFDFLSGRHDFQPAERGELLEAGTYRGPSSQIGLGRSTRKRQRKTRDARKHHHLIVGWR